ncbi:TRAP transporter large permease [Pasteurella skyensis]|uniref:TRAP transporter large permease protein n=1 Tax=Phocoenobacter skyensis TaxID=97481 RepID=A0AAJ6N930_9PAST|nr:TRAP transporter large permease [Pasteurella skyensis]MDP8162506.1 TRAP transporter large permease [Pasteurella skyensis]MDP8172471.1 TRAP transporter large permease [Pasteurella skyensis]MDP8177496.1 TRAP transporter large permease [Pasteurella skyensis]MDP8178726.1 TRAP transporter large permease [Pasteurella skyensis]MDP8182984.1 TRAP transporter large permease [Pasteurella skyensis]
MSAITIGILALILLIIAIFLHVPVAIAMAGVGLLATCLLTGNINGGLSLFADATVETLSYSGFMIIPLFILMGGFAGISGLSRDLYRLSSSWLGWAKGGVALSTIGTCAGFGAICGSSVATTATMVNMALPEMQKRHYSNDLSAGVIIGGSTLGSIIPPSMIMVIYAIQAQQSVKDLFVGALFPGFIAVIFCLIAVRVFIWFKPESAPEVEITSMKDKLYATVSAWGVMLIGLLMTIGIYKGIVTVDEAAALGLLLTLGFAIFRKQLTKEKLISTLIDSAGNVGMVYLILIGAKIFSIAMTQSGVAQAFVSWILSLGLAPLAIIFLLVIAYIAMGAIFDAMAAMILTLPFVLPIISELGYNLVWWGIVNVMIIEVGMITPPVGINMFVFHGMRPDVPLSDLYRGVVPFVIAGLVRIALVIIFPVTVTYLIT